MRWSDMLLMSLSSLWKRKLRTVLTVLGVVIGTTSIVVMISMGIGFSKSYEEMLESFGGLTRITVQSPTIWMSPEEIKRDRNAVKLDDKMIEKIRAMPGVVSVLPFKEIPINQLLTGKYEAYANVMAVDMGALQVYAPDMQLGRLPEDSDKLEIAIGNWVRTNFRIPNSRSSGRMEFLEDGPADIDYLKDRFTLRMTSYSMTPDGGGQQTTRNFKVTLVGVTGKQDYDFGGYVIMSDKAADKIIKKNKKIFEDAAKNGMYKPDQYNQCWVKTTDMDATIAVAKQLTELKLNAQHNANEIDSMQQQSQNTQMLLGGIGGVAMLVAAISIANTMLMSIYERTKEIGVMKVLGCRLSNIRVLFLGEAALIGLLGGILGLAMSFGLSYVLNAFVFAGNGGGGGGMIYIPGQMQSIIPLWLALLGLAFSTFIGVLAGLYPAQRAMGLSALAAIRNE